MYLLRLDDASEHWNKENWSRIHELCSAYNIKPILAIIPHNEDQKLTRFPLDIDYNQTIHSWINEGWTPALHGYNHVYITDQGGINPVNQRSEFAGVDSDLQRMKIRSGIAILHDMDIMPRVFVAPAHTFDRNTLLALKEESEIRIISDTVARDVYREDGFYFIPQQMGNVRRVNFPVTTFCYHPNNMRESSFKDLEVFFRRYSVNFSSFDRVELKDRPLSFSEKIMRKAYWQFRSLRRSK